ncbi:MAG: Fe-S cluster assembly protein SufD [Candidatus Omnitrophica bacterium]|nr:Fe-S cluster assembly protein SufD [Candidatus Omnitrophota bacterium]
MTEALNATTIDQLTQRLKEPAWVAELRHASLRRHAELPWPNPSDEIWRRTDVSVFDPARPLALPSGNGLFQGVRVSEEIASRLTEPIAGEHLAARVDGQWVARQLPFGVVVGDFSEVMAGHGEAIRRVIDADSLTPPEQKLTTLNLAFHHDPVFVGIPAGFTGEVPLRLACVLSVQPGLALFPLTVVVVGRGSRITLIQEEIGASAQAGEGPHVINGRIELVLEPQASVQYCRVQRWDRSAHEFVLQRATLQEGAQLSMVNIHIGGQVSKTHVIAKLQGQGASSRVFGFLFGHGRQHLDYHSLQDHQAPHTTSDLLYKAALKDQSRMIYTGLIRIAKAAKQTDAFQANHNLLLGAGAKAETIPMLEILADDVRCKHGATVGPVDEDQLFYLTTRGIPRLLAERLLVMGFVEPVLEQVPFEPLRDRLRAELEGSL